MASVFALKPEVVLLDEPTAELDPVGTEMVFEAAGLLAAQGRHILEVLRGYNAAGNTVVIISHDMALVAQFATRIVAMHAGRVLADGDPRSVFTIPETLRLTNITPPQVAVFGSRVGLPGVLTVAEAVERIIAELGIRIGDLDRKREFFYGSNELAPGQGGV